MGVTDRRLAFSSLALGNRCAANGLCLTNDGDWQRMLRHSSDDGPAIVVEIPARLGLF
jgi:hypothetical protein